MRLSIERLAMGVAFAAGAALSFGPAQADGGPGGSLKDPPVAAAGCKWGGAYVGVDTGVGVTRTPWTFPTPEVDTSGGVFTTPAPRVPEPTQRFFETTPGSRYTSRDRSWLYSGHVGVNVPLPTPEIPLVVGVEIAYTNGNFDKSQRSPFDGNDTFRTRISDIWELKGRLGYTWNCLMAYTKFGYAQGEVGTTAVGSTTPGGFPIAATTRNFTPGAGNQSSGGNSETHRGTTLGGGLEYMLTNNIVVGFEYDWVHLNRRSESTPVISTTTGGQVSTLNRSIESELHLFTLRLSYKFGP